MKQMKYAKVVFMSRNGVNRITAQKIKKQNIIFKTFQRILFWAKQELNFLKIC